MHTLTRASPHLCLHTSHTPVTQHWAERIPQITSADGKAKVRLWAGQLQGQGALAPPPNSWAADQDNEVMILHIDIAPGGMSSQAGCA